MYKWETLSELCGSSDERSECPSRAVIEERRIDAK
jgi:hypothetical protein